MNWPVAVVLSTFNWKSGKEIDFQLQFPISSIVFVNSMAARSRQQSGAVFFYRRQDCVLTNNLWFEFEDPSSTRLPYLRVYEPHLDF
jgi:hypothetical protein